MDKILESRMTGFFKSRILSVNPNEKELKELLEEAEVEIPEYNYEKRGGTKISIIDVYLSDSNDEMFKHSIYLEDKDKKSTNSGAKLYINQLGDTLYTDSEDNLWDSFKFHQDKVWDNDAKKYEIKGILGEKLYHVSKVGEAELINLIKVISDSNPKDIGTSYFINIDKILNGDFSELKEIIPIGIPCMTAFAYSTIDGKQQIYKEFLSLNMFSDMCSNFPSKYTKRIYDNWHKSFSYIVDDSVYNFGKLRKVKKIDIPKSKEVDVNSSDY